MIKLSCKEAGLDCDYTAEGRTEDEVLKAISEHAVIVHSMKTQDIYEQNIAVAFLCQVMGKMKSTHNEKEIV